MDFRILLTLLVVHACSGQLGDDAQYRITSGNKVDITQFPYQAAVEFMSHNWCGAAVISVNVLLTAAHCLQPIRDRENISPLLMSVRVGSSISGSGGTVYAIKKGLQHERYDHNSYVDEFDIGLIFTVGEIKYTDKVMPISLPNEPPKVGDMAYVTGYGRREDMISASRGVHLSAIMIPIVDSQLCKAIYWHFGKEVRDTMLCAGEFSGHKDACNGDSGGPLVVNGTIAGIVGWEKGCGREGIPANPHIT